MDKEIREAAVKAVGVALQNVSAMDGFNALFNEAMSTFDREYQLAKDRAEVIARRKAEKKAGAK